MQSQTSKGVCVCGEGEWQTDSKIYRKMKGPRITKITLKKNANWELKY